MSNVKTILVTVIFAMTLFLPIAVEGVEKEKKDELTQRVNALEARVAALEAAVVLSAFVTVDTVTTINGLAPPHIFITGANVHIRSGVGSTDGDTGSGPTVNGLGNLIVGYDEVRSSGSAKSGSHNVVIGRNHNYTSFGGLVVGFQNTISAPAASVSAGAFNMASDINASVSGGRNNEASAADASVSGGRNNDAAGLFSVVLGGNGNITTTTDDIFP